jgi:hypothetical protein
MNPLPSGALGLPVLVTWRDSAEYKLEWRSQDALHDMTLATIETVGFLVLVRGAGDQQDSIVLASDRDGHGDWKNFTVIPAESIVGLRVLETRD